MRRVNTKGLDSSLYREAHGEEMAFGGTGDTELSSSANKARQVQALSKSPPLPPSIHPILTAPMSWQGCQTWRSDARTSKQPHKERSSPEKEIIAVFSHLSAQGHKIKTATITEIPRGNLLPVCPSSPVIFHGEG